MTVDLRELESILKVAQKNKMAAETGEGQFDRLFSHIFFRDES